MCDKKENQRILMNNIMGEAQRHGIPDYMVKGIAYYIVLRINSGDFLMAVLENDLKEACLLADKNNRNLLWNYIDFLWNKAPSGCWGSKEKVQKWLEAKDVEV